MTEFQPENFSQEMKDQPSFSLTSTRRRVGPPYTLGQSHQNRLIYPFNVYCQLYTNVNFHTLLPSVTDEETPDWTQEG